MKSKSRCPWVPPQNQLMVDYHDKEWGRPVHNDRVHFEFLILEGAQAGLSWETVLKKRENYRHALWGFDPRRLARATKRDVQRWMKNPGLIRHQLKLESVITNAKAFLSIQKEFKSFDEYVWSFVDHKPVRHRVRRLRDYPTRTPESDALSKDLKKRGFRFVGSTIMYAYMQAMGLANDHSMECFLSKKE